jgi:hypothetical protein
MNVLPRGAFVRGAGSLPLYNGSALIGKGVIVVTFNESPQIPISG